MKKFVCLLLMLAHAGPAWCCLNKTGTKFGGGWGIVSSSHLLRSLAKDLRPDGVEMEAILRGSNNFNDRSDYAIALMYLGRSAEAVDLLNALESEKPGEFYIAANLGTAYELSRNNQEALRWINEGIRRNPDDHEGTEWLHSKILESKIAQENDPTYFENHTVLELQPGAIGQLIRVGERSYSAQELSNAIEYQLSERLQFVKPPDPAVASLLYDYAAIEAVIGSMESAKQILELAGQYGYPAPKIKVLDAEFDRRLWWASLKIYGLIAAGCLVALALLVVLYRRGIFVISSEDLKRN